MKTICWIGLTLGFLGVLTFFQDKAYAQEAVGFEQLTLKIETTDKPIIPMQPVPFNITLLNNSGHAVLGHTAIDPGAGFLEIYLSEDGKQFNHYETADWEHDNVSPTTKELPAGYRRTVRKYIWRCFRPGDKRKLKATFPMPGRYYLKATLKTVRGKQKITSNVVTVTVVEPTGLDKSAWDYLRSLDYPDFILRTDYDLRDRDAAVIKLQEFAARFAGSKYATLANYSLGRNLRAAGQLDEASRALVNAATDKTFLLRDEVLYILVSTCVKQENLEKASRYLATLKRDHPASNMIRIAEDRINRYEESRLFTRDSPDSP